MEMRWDEGHLLRIIQKQPHVYITSSVLQVAVLPWLCPVHTVQGITWTKLIHIVMTEMYHLYKMFFDIRIAHGKARTLVIFSENFVIQQAVLWWVYLHRNRLGPEPRGVIYCMSAEVINCNVDLKVLPKMLQLTWLTCNEMHLHYQS